MMETLILHPENKAQLNALKAMAKALGINFETGKPYNPDYVARIEKSKEEVRAGKISRIKTEDLESFLGL